MSTPHSHRSPYQILSGSSKTQQWPVFYQPSSGTLPLDDLATCFTDLGGEREIGVQLQGWKHLSLQLLDTDQEPSPPDFWVVSTPTTCSGAMAPLIMFSLWLPQSHIFRSCFNETSHVYLRETLYHERKLEPVSQHFLCKHKGLLET